MTVLLRQVVADFTKQRPDWLPDDWGFSADVARVESQDAYEVCMVAGPPFKPGVARKVFQEFWLFPGKLLSGRGGGPVVVVVDAIYSGLQQCLRELERQVCLFLGPEGIPKRKPVPKFRYQEAKKIQARAEPPPSRFGLIGDLLADPKEKK